MGAVAPRTTGAAFRGWRLLLALATACLPILLGCGKSYFLTESDFTYANQLAAVAAHDTTPPVPQFTTLAPDRVRTVDDPDGERRPISLAECIALALEHGRVEGRTIRVFMLDPAIAAASIEQSLAKFDARWLTSLTWNTVDQPLAIAPPGVPNPADFTLQQQTANFDSQLVKPLPTGGIAGLTFRTDYTFTRTSGFNNPLYAPALTFGFEQPLLRGNGVLINQIRSSHPGSVLLAGGGGSGAVPGILITRIGFDQARTDFARRVMDLLFQVEQAYWNLYCSYWGLYSREVGQRTAFDSWQTGKKLLEAGRLTVQDLAAIEEQYQAFRGERLRALGNGSGLPGVLEAERQLRLVLGLPVEDGQRLIPTDLPTVDPYQPDWAEAAQQALAERPELIRARQDVATQELLVFQSRNFLLPDLRFLSNYNVNGLGSQLDGPDPKNALGSLTDNRFNNWTLGFRLDVPLGFREPHAQLRRDELILAQLRFRVRDLEEQILFELQRSYRQLLENAEQLRIQQARLDASKRELSGRLKEFQAGLGITQVFLIAQRKYTDALLNERLAACQYNTSLADFQRQRGTILGYDNVTIAEGPLPVGVQEQASAHLQERSKALALRERPALQPRPSAEPPALEEILPETAVPAQPGLERLPLPKLLEQLPLPKTLPQ